MKINWNPNPLATTIDVDDRDRRIIRAYLQREMYSNLLCRLDMQIEKKIKPHLESIEEIHKEIKKWGDICDMKIDHEDIQDLVDELQLDHMGDCVSQPCACMKCRAESAIGFETIKGLKNSQGHKLMIAFSDGRDINQAIEHLKTPYRYENRHKCWEDTDEESYMRHTVRWQEEKDAALVWLLEYKEKHGF